MFPPKFTLVSGERLTFDVEMHHVRFITAFVGQPYELDWIEINAAVAGSDIALDCFTSRLSGFLKSCVFSDSRGIIVDNPYPEIMATLRQKHSKQS